MQGHVALLFSSVLTSFVNFSSAFIGVARYKNGTDIELREWHKTARRCGDTTLITTNSLFVYNDTVCGYACAWQNTEPYSSYRMLSQGGLTCKRDLDIRQTCTTGSIGQPPSNTSHQIPVLTIEQLENKQILYRNHTKLSRCNFTDSCSKLRYLDASSEWRDTALHTCFRVSVGGNFTHPSAEVRISCSNLKKSQLEGQLLKIEMSCFIDSDQKNYDTCFMFKIAGKYLVSDKNEDLKKKCVKPPIPIVTTTLAPIATTLAPIIITTTTIVAITTEAVKIDNTDEEGFLIPYGIIIIILVIIFIIVIIGIICWRRRKRAKTFNKERKKSAVNHGNGVATSIDTRVPASGNIPPLSVSGFTNPMFVTDDNELRTLPTNVDYAVVNKRKLPPVDAIDNTTHAHSGEILYEEIPANKVSKDRSLEPVEAVTEDIHNQYPRTEDKGDTSKSNLTRIASKKGSLHDVKFQTPEPHISQRAPIYNNSSIPTSPIQTLRNPADFHGDSYIDAPLSDGADIISVQLDEMYQQPVHRGMFFASPSNETIDQVYNIPSPLPEDSYLDVNYDIVPKGNSRKPVIENGTRNFRRPLPEEVQVKRIPYTFWNYDVRKWKGENHSAPAFYLLVANYFIQCKEQENTVEDMLRKLQFFLQIAEDIWMTIDDNGGEGTSVDEAAFILKSTSKKDDIAFKLGEEMSWNTEQTNTRGMSPFDALHQQYTKHVHSNKRECLILTFHDGVHAVCLFDSHGNQIFLDLNVHYKNSVQSKELALVDGECGGVLLHGTKRNSDFMLNYILTNMCLEMKCNARRASAVPVFHKHQYTGESTTSPDFI